MLALLTTLTHAPAEPVKQLAEALLSALGDVRVVTNRTGLVMLPYTDSVTGAAFHLGEVLVSEAHIVLSSGVEGYALVTGRDLVQALAIAVIDAAYRAGVETGRIEAFVREQAEAQAAADRDLLMQVEATRVELETF
ncbi:MAG: phosphonate C-P lyase system protein PhnG [Anaerolinea sp.]|nr:phosphonate C-P lyase system protein PhnG [Anaerolinea sp.]